MPEQKTVNTDGRRARSERSREAIIQAMINLVDDGVLIPTAQQVSDRAGVGIRTVFRHFSDMESLFAEIDAHARDLHEDIFAGGDRQGSLDERLVHAAEQHALAYERVGKLFLCTQAQIWRYEILRQQYARAQRRIRADLETWLPELNELDPQEREMVDAVASFEYWHRLREHQGLSKRASIDLVAALLRKIIL